MPEYYRISGVAEDERHEELFSYDAMIELEQSLLSKFSDWNGGGGDAAYLAFMRQLLQHLAMMRDLLLASNYALVPLVSVVDLPHRTTSTSLRLPHWMDITGDRARCHLPTTASSQQLPLIDMTYYAFGRDVEFEVFTF